MRSGNELEKVGERAEGCRRRGSGWRWRRERGTGEEILLVGQGQGQGPVGGAGLGPGWCGAGVEGSDTDPRVVLGRFQDGWVPVVAAMKGAGWSALSFAGCWGATGVCREQGSASS